MNIPNANATKTTDGLALLKKLTTVQWLLAGAIGLVVVLAYFVWPTTGYGSIADWLIVYWKRSEDYSHGFLVPFISLGLFIYKWRDFPAVKPDSTRLGMTAFALALALYWVGVKAQRPHFAAVSFIVLSFGFLLYLGGWEFTKAASFPVAFLFFMVPMGFFLDGITFELRIIVSIVATSFLNIIGIKTVRVGTSINPSPMDPAAALEVADPCSGIRSLVMLTALASLYGYLTLNKTWKKWALFAAAIPLAVAANVVRITIIAMISRVFGVTSALHVYDKWSGFIVFGVAVVSLVFSSILLNTDYRRLMNYWLQEHTPLPRRRLAGQAPNE